MIEKQIRIKQKSDTSANWDSSDLVLLKGEIGVETDSNKVKIGDGTSKWNELSYLNEEEIERLQYYGDKNEAVSPKFYFKTSGGINIIGLTDSGQAESSLTVPYKINGEKIVCISIGVSQSNTLLKSIKLPNSITDLGDAAFRNYSALKSINIPNKVTRITGGAFLNCTSLTSINIPDKVTVIGAQAFANCTSLTSIDVPNSITNIQQRAFYGCTSLASINIPNSVISIGTDAFTGCTSLIIYCEQGSYAETYAKENSIPVVYTDIKSTALDNKVDKVAGKSLIDENVAKYITYNPSPANDECIHIDNVTHYDAATNSMITDYKGGLKLGYLMTNSEGNIVPWGSEATLTGSSLTMGDVVATKPSLSISQFGISLTDEVTPLGYEGSSIVLKTSTQKSDITVVKPMDYSGVAVTHNLSEKANTADVLVKNDSGNFVYGGTTISETQVSVMGHNLTNKWTGNVYDISVPVSTWTEMTDTDNQKYYYKKLTVSNMVSNGQPMIDIVLSSNIASARKEIEAFQCISRVVTGSGYIEMFCFDEAPTTAFTLRILVLGNTL